jgi:oxygen-independent coproporphyrinogen-3 oxidase
MDHFAKRTDEMAIAQKNKTLYRNFQGYSTKAGCDLYGFGMSAIGHFKETYQQNKKTLIEYYKTLNENSLVTNVGYRMTNDDQIRKAVIIQIMCDMELDKASVERQFGITFDTYFIDALHKLEAFVPVGLVTLSKERIVVNGLGRLIIRNIAMCFDAYLEQMMKERPIFSRTV